MKALKALRRCLSKVINGQQYSYTVPGGWAWRPVKVAPAPWDRFLNAGPTIVHLLYSPCWESPPIRKGCPAQKFWRYQNRMDRIDRLRQRYEASKGRELLMVESLWFGDLTITTMEHCEDLGYCFDTDENTGNPRWYDPQGKAVLWASFNS